MTLTIIGAGYVGLVSAAVFSELGNKVFCVDINKDRIKDLKRWLGIQDTAAISPDFLGHIDSKTFIPS